MIFFYLLNLENGRFRWFLKSPGHFQPVLAMKFLVESEFQGQGPPRTQETSITLAWEKVKEKQNNEIILFDRIEEIFDSIEEVLD